jgi:Fe-S-cluster-containing hydrogenase component 2
MHPTKNVAVNCDLCRGRDSGPICVQFCTMHALSYTQIRG